MFDVVWIEFISYPLSSGVNHCKKWYTPFLACPGGLTKVSKPLAQAADQLETYSSIVAFAVILYFSQSGGESASGDLVQAGFFTGSRETLLLIAAAFNIIVINTVKFFFETLILLSPIPAVDAFFEVLNKSVAAALAAVYAFSPTLATILNVLIFLVCLIIFKAVWRRVRYFRAVLFGLLSKKPPERMAVPGAIARSVPEAELALPVFVKTKRKGFPKLARAYLVRAGEGWTLLRARLLGMGPPQPLDGAVELTRGYLTHTVRISETGLAATRRYEPLLDSRPDLFPSAGTAPASQPASSLRGAFAPDHRAALRAEL
jgi:hypothetical protein